MITVLHGDCAGKLPELAAESVDAIVTDPPYGLEFMGKEWDRFDARVGRGSRVATERATEMTPQGRGHSTPAGPYLAARIDSVRIAGKPYQAWCETWAAECLRVLKPGGHLLAFGGARTYHRLVCAIEDAGLEIRDSLHWMYGSGFPKSLNAARAIDRHMAPGDPEPPVSAEGEPWTGWGTALKPGHEPIVLARKPLTGTVAANVLAHGTGALNVDGCRVGRAEGDRTEYGRDTVLPPNDSVALGHFNEISPYHPHNAGRWPPNILLTHSAECAPAGTRTVRSSQPAVFHRAAAERDGNTSAAYGAESRPEGHVTPGYGDADGTETMEAWDCAPGCPVAGLGAQSGASRGVPRSPAARGRRPGGFGDVGADKGGSLPNGPTYADTGGASRFFPQLAWSPEYDAPFMYQAKAGRKERPRIDGLAAHPTVKPLALMRWLVRLVTPPGGLVLDPFAGTGTTGEACHLEGFDCVLVERDADYIKLIEARMDKYAQEAA